MPRHDKKEIELGARFNDALEDYLTHVLPNEDCITPAMDTVQEALDNVIVDHSEHVEMLWNYNDKSYGGETAEDYTAVRVKMLEWLEEVAESEDVSLVSIEFKYQSRD